MEFTEFVKPELMVLIPVLYLVGAAIKKAGTIDRWIPLILGGAGIVIAGLYVFATAGADGQNAFMMLFVALTQGILAAGSSVYVNQVFRQLRNKE